MGLYADPRVYDVLFTPGTAAEISGLERVAARHGGAGPRRRAGVPPRRTVWLEPACGSGRYLRLLAARGYSVVGFDREPAMVAYTRDALARRRLDRRATLFVADMTRFADRVGEATIDVAFNLLNTIRHLDSDRALRAHFREMARVLKPGGLYAVGLSLTPSAGEEPTEDVFSAARGALRVEQVVQYLPPGHDPATPDPRSETVLSHLTVTSGGRTESRSSRYLLRCYDAAQWDAILDSVPFDAVDCVNERGTSIGELAWPYGIQVLRRR